MLRSIIDVKKFSEDYHSTDSHVVTINGVLANNIVIKFISTSRNDTSYKIDYTSSTRDLSYTDRVTYAAMNNMYKKVVRDIEEIFSYLEIDISKEEVNKIGDIVCECISKCESRYGMNTKDFDTYEADAVITIQGEDNGKEKHIVKFYDELTDLQVEDYPITYGCGRVVKVDNYIKWLIDKDSCSFSDLLTEVISSFENPYIIISNDYEIILDFRFDTKKYEGHQMPNNVEDEIKVYLEQVSVVAIQEDDIVDDDIILLSDIINGTQYKLLHCGNEIARSDFDFIPSSDILLHFNNVLDSEHYFDV